MKRRRWSCCCVLAAASTLLPAHGILEVAAAAGGLLGFQRPSMSAASRYRESRYRRLLKPLARGSCRWRGTKTRCELFPWDKSEEGKQKKAKKDEEDSVWWFTRPWDQPTRRSGRPRKEEGGEEGGWWFRMPWDQPKPTKRRGGPRKEEEEEEEGEQGLSIFGWVPFRGFADFNSAWKSQITLSNKIKKLEKEVVRDYRRGSVYKARAAQYRYDVMKTLEEVQSQVIAVQEESRKLDVQDAKVLEANKDLFKSSEPIVKPEDLDELLKKERSLLNAMALDDQQWARIGSACVGVTIALAVFHTNDFFSVLGAAAFMTFLTTRPGFVGDAARLSGYGVVSSVKVISTLERRFEVLRRAGDWLRDTLEASIPFQLPWSEAPSWRNAYKGEGFLHPGIRPPPPMRDFQYVEYLREVKRWVEMEQVAVMDALKKKEDDRVQREMDRQAMQEQVQKVLTGLWEAATSPKKPSKPKVDEAVQEESKGLDEEGNDGYSVEAMDISLDDTIAGATGEGAPMMEDMETFTATDGTATEPFDNQMFTGGGAHPGESGL